MMERVRHCSITRSIASDLWHDLEKSRTTLLQTVSSASTTGAQRGHRSRRNHRPKALSRTHRRVAPVETGRRNNSKTGVLIMIASGDHRELAINAHHSVACCEVTVSSETYRRAGFLIRRLEPPQEGPTSIVAATSPRDSLLKFVIWLLHRLSEPTLDVRARRSLRKGVPLSSDREVSLADPLRPPQFTTPQAAW